MKCNPCQMLICNLLALLKKTVETIETENRTTFKLKCAQSRNNNYYYPEVMKITEENIGRQSHYFMLLILINNSLRDL